MSDMFGIGRSPEVGETVGTYREYDGAVKAVAKLIEAGVPARDISITGTALRSVERVTGRLGWAQAAWSGAVNGVLIGLLLGAMAVIWTPQLAIGAFVGMILLGVALGMVFRIASYAIIRRRRDFQSITQVVADHYEVSVARASAAKARSELGAQVQPRRVEPVDPRTLSEPPRYGVRVDPQTGRPLGAPAEHGREQAEDRAPVPDGPVAGRQPPAGPHDEASAEQGPIVSDPPADADQADESGDDTRTEVVEGADRRA